jgi:tetratricopeptide (TPR) repeat protein
VWFNNLENFDEAVRSCRKALDLAREQDLGARPGMALSALSVPLRSRGDLEEALQAADEAVRILEPPAGGTDEGRMSNFILALGRKGGILSNEGISLGRPAEAVPPLERAFQLSEELARRDPNDASSRGHLAYAGNRLAGVLRDSDPQRALAIYDHTVLRLGEIQSNRKARRDEVKSLAGSTYPLRSLGRVSEAKQRLDAAFALLKQLKAYPQEKIDLGSEAEITVRALADLEAGDGNVARALEIYRKLLAQVLAAQPKPETLLQDAADLSRLYETMVPLYRRSGHVDEASALEKKRLELWQQWDRKLPKNAFVLRKLASPPR